MMAAPAKRRRVNFTDEELHVMLVEVKERKDVIMGKFDARITKEAKHAAWQAIAAAVYSVSPTGVTRNSEELRKKFYDFRSFVKKKCAAINRDMQGTGGGLSTAQPLTGTEELMAALISDVAVSGVPGILDSEEDGSAAEVASEGIMGATLEVQLNEDFEIGLENLEPLEDRSYSFRPISSQSNISEPSRPSSTSASRHPSRQSPQGVATQSTPNVSTPISTEPLAEQRAHILPSAEERGSPSLRSRRRRQQEPIGTQMLQVQEEIRDCLKDSQESLKQIATSVAHIPAVAQALQLIAASLPAGQAEH